MIKIDYTFPTDEAQAFARSLLKASVAFTYVNLGPGESRVTLLDFSDKPKIICLCGSTRFADEFEKQNRRLTLEGYIVLTIGANVSDESLGILQDSETKKKLDDLHLRKIDLCDEVFVINVDGYIGKSTRSEILYAHSQYKIVKYLHPDNHVSR